MKKHITAIFRLADVGRLAIILSVFLFVSTSEISGQDTDMWKTLAMVTFDKVYDENYGFEIEKPIMSPLITAYDGKEIQVSGFFIPLTGKTKQAHFMLSRYPESMCFFCGAAGPESAMQVFMADGKKVGYSTDKITVEGTLRVNALDAANLIYTLENAKLIE